jgi:hypothetical protein
MPTGDLLVAHIAWAVCLGHGMPIFVLPFCLRFWYAP